MIEFHRAAVEEAVAAAAWYAERSVDAGLAFLAELDRSIPEILERPLAWPEYFHGTRRYLMHRFPYQIVYRERDDIIQILAVAHARRRPGYWRDRT